MNGPASGSLRNGGWLLGVVVIVALVVYGARGTPRDGQSEDRVYAIAGEMKCLQCAGESVAGSQADIAIKMRSEIRAQMKKGNTDDEILGYFAARYGQRVLLNPSGDGVTSLVWIVPVVAAGAGVLGLAFAFANWRRQRDDAGHREVSAEDRAVVDAALAGGAATTVEET